MVEFCLMAIRQFSILNLKNALIFEILFASLQAYFMYGLTCVKLAYVSARMIGGLGHCGQELCCARMGGEFSPVSIRMAKEQNLSLNPQKISGCCGRLMCCLRYEYEAYKEVNSRAPGWGKNRNS